MLHVNRSLAPAQAMWNGSETMAAKKKSTKKSTTKKSAAKKKSATKKSAAKKKSTTKKSAAKKKSSRRYSEKAQKKVGRVMHEAKHGQLRAGRSGKRVTSRKQAIAIALSEARKSGAKVPPRKTK
jgi:hypothetical protein